MIDTKQQLRLSGFTVNEAGHIVCFREPGTRWAQERCAVIRIDLEKDSKTGRDIVEQLIEAADSPRALVARTKNGSAVLLFKADKLTGVPVRAERGVLKLATRDGETRFTITIGSEGQSVDVASHTWKRSPLDVSRDSLQLLTYDVSESVVDAAFKSCTYASIVDQEQRDAAKFEKLKTDIESGAVKILTAEEQQIVDDDALVAEYAGKDIGWNDGLWAGAVINARRRVAFRKQQPVATAVA